MKTRRKIEDAIIGAVVADAVGVPFEFESKQQMDRYPAKGMIGHGTHDQPKGTWSDDSSLLLCQAEAIAQTGQCNLRLQAKKFVAWKNRGYMTPHGRVFDIGGCTFKAIQRLATLKSADVQRAGGAGERDQGNGSLMRILPACLFLATADREVRQRKIRQMSSMTHRHPVCQWACVLYAEIVRHLLLGDGCVQYAYKAAIAETGPQIVAAGLEKPFKRLLAGDVYMLDRSAISGDGWVISCLEAAIWAAARGKSFEHGVLLAVNLGSDTDTTACVAGGLLGLIFNIPQKWETGIARSAMVVNLACDFAIVCKTTKK